MKTKNQLASKYQWIKLCCCFAFTAIISFSAYSQADLQLAAFEAPAKIKAGERLVVSWKVSNEGQSSVSEVSTGIYLSTDDILSSDDSLFYTNINRNLEARDTGSIRWGFDWLTLDYPISGVYYFIAKVDHLDELSESDEGNNEWIRQIEFISNEPPAECVQSIGEGQLLCTELQADGTIEAYLLNDDGVSLVHIDQEGGVLSTQDFGPLQEDSLQVAGDQLIRKSPAGTVLWQRTIPAAIYEFIPEVEAAAELADGSFVMGGFRKNPYFPGSPQGRDSLLIVKTDAGFNVLDTAIIYQNTWALLSDRLNYLRAWPDGSFTAIYSTNFVINPFPYLNIKRLSADLEEEDHYGHSHFRLKTFIQTPCGQHYYRGDQLFETYAGEEELWFDLANSDFRGRRGVGEGNVERVGDFRSYNYSRVDTDTLRASILYFSDADSLPDLKIKLHRANGQQDSLLLPFTFFNQIIATSDSTVLILREKNGEVFAYAPHCNSRINNWPNCLSAVEASPDLWISEVRLGTTLHQLSGGSAYSDFTGDTYEVTKGQALPLQLKADFNTMQGDVYWQVWVDLNHNLNFDERELLYEGIIEEDATETMLQTQLKLPVRMPTGQTKMRLVLTEEPAARCNAVAYGEVEDYLLDIKAAPPFDPGVFDRSKNWPLFSIFPNPADTHIFLNVEEWEGQTLYIEVYNQLGQPIWQRAYPEAPYRSQINTQDWPRGSYSVQLRNEEGLIQTQHLLLHR